MPWSGLGTRIGEVFLVASSNGAAVGSALAAMAKGTWTPLAVPGTDTGGVGLALTENIAASAASKVMPRPVRSALPMFLIVNVRLASVFTVTLPKSFVVPLAMAVPAGCSTLIFGAGGSTMTRS